MCFVNESQCCCNLGLISVYVSVSVPFIPQQTAAVIHARHYRTVWFWPKTCSPHPGSSRLCTKNPCTARKSLNRSMNLAFGRIYAALVKTEDREKASPHSGNTPHGSPCPSKLPGWFPQSPGGTKRDLPHYISPMSHLSDGPISSSSQVWSLQLPHEATHTTCTDWWPGVALNIQNSVFIKEILIFSLDGRWSI